MSSSRDLAVPEEWLKFSSSQSTVQLGSDPSDAIIKGIFPGGKIAPAPVELQAQLQKFGISTTEKVRGVHKGIKYTRVLTQHSSPISVA
jgi:hypothetical protein